MTIKRSLSPARRGKQPRAGQHDEPAQIAAPARPQQPPESGRAFRTAGLHRGRRGILPALSPLTAVDSTPLTHSFLIANAGLEFRLTYRKLSALKISNRKWIAF